VGKVFLDKFVIMLNHMYGIISLNDIWVQNFEPLLLIAHLVTEYLCLKSIQVKNVVESFYLNKSGFVVFCRDYES